MNTSSEQCSYGTSKNAEMMLPTDLLLSIEEQCDAFERMLKQGQLTRLAAILESFPENGRAALLRELIKLEQIYHRDRGQHEYQRLFPQFASLIAHWYAAPQAETADFRLSTQHYSPCSNAQTQENTSAPPSTQQNPTWKEVWKSSGLADDPLFSSRYEVIDEVGRGAMGLVLHGRHRVLNRPVAIKLMLPHATSDRFLREAKLLATLNSPHVVTIYDYFLLNKSCPALVMEWVTAPLSHSE